MEIIKQDKINEDFGIVLQYFGREGGYEICISARNQPDSWFECDGSYSVKRDALQVYNAMKKEYKNKRLKMTEGEIDSIIENAINKLCHENPSMTDKEIITGLKRYVENE